MPTPLQLRLIHVAVRQVGMNDAAYRVLLKNAGKVGSSKDLDQAGFEDVMAVLEDSGFQDTHNSPTYWRDKVAARGSTGNARMMHLIHQLAERSIYSLDRLAWRFSDGRTEDVNKLTPREAWKLIEMLKGSNKRTEAKRDQQPTLF